MVSTYASRIRLIAVVCLLALLPIATAGRIEDGVCPADTEEAMVHTPFKPYFKWPEFQGSVQRCWMAADCLFEAAGESRKQQWAATALVMGLIPLTMKDIAWPERRIIHLTKQPNMMIELLVLALGLVPQVTSSTTDTRENLRSNWIGKRALKKGAIAKTFWITVFTIFLGASYAGLAWMEIYSKRSALGCPFPVFVVTWHVVALVPAGVHVFFRRIWGVPTTTTQERLGQPDPKTGLTTTFREESQECAKASNDSAIQGADEAWPVQLTWVIYYIAGTLIFTSIMAVTVAELVAWVGLACTAAGASKLLAFYVCVAQEKAAR